MSDCVITVHLEKDHEYEMSLVGGPTGNKLFLLMQIPYDDDKKATIETLSPIFDLAKSMNEETIYKNRMTIKRKDMCWILKDAFFRRVDMIDEWDDEALIYIDIEYSDCSILRRIV